MSITPAHAEPIDAPLPWNDRQETTVTQSAPSDEAPVTILKRVEAHLNAMKTLSAEFTQVAPDGGHASGRLFLQRPGKMRWQYHPPTPILMVSNGDTLTYYDYELDQLSYLPLDDTLASFLTRPNIDLTDDALRIIDFRAGAKSIRFTLLQTHKLDEGSLTLEFSDTPLQLKSMTMTDAAGQHTIIRLYDVAYDLVLDDSLFRFDNPRGNLRNRNYQR